MFTVLIRDRNGNERIREAIEVRRVSVTSNDPLGYEAGVLIRWDEDLGEHLGETLTSDDEKWVYVMNRHGATVATYRL